MRSPEDNVTGTSFPMEWEVAHISCCDCSEHLSRTSLRCPPGQVVSEHSFSTCCEAHCASASASGDGGFSCCSGLHRASARRPLLQLLMVSTSRQPQPDYGSSIVMDFGHGVSPAAPSESCSRTLPNARSIVTDFGDGVSHAAPSDSCSRTRPNGIW